MAEQSLNVIRTGPPYGTRQQPDEAALVAAAQEDARAFAPLYDRYLDPIYRYCYRRLGSREAAEDATSLVFARALAALPGCDPASFRPWLFAIAHNALANALRDRRSVDSLLLATELADLAPTPEEEALAADERRSLRALLARLPDEQRRILELRLAGLSGPETAAALGKTPGAVRTAQHRAFVRLRLLLGDVATGVGHVGR